MRKLFLGTVSLVALAGLVSTGHAQTFFDGPTPIWTGPYIGIEGGAGWGSSRHSDATGFDSGSFSTNGGLVGGTAGYNWEMPNRFVLGVEGDMSWAAIGGSSGGAGGACAGSPPICTTKLNSFGTVRGRVGYAAGRFLPYVTGGLAFGDIYGREGDLAANGAFGSGHSFEPGWTVGGGLEAALTPQWSAKFEYLYADLGNNHVFNDLNVTGPTTSTPQAASFHTNILRLGINYKF